LVYLSNSMFSTFPRFQKTFWPNVAERYFTSLCVTVESGSRLTFFNLLTHLNVEGIKNARNDI